MSTAGAPSRRRYRVRFFIIPVGLIIFGAVYLVRLLTGSSPVNCDFLDSACLARAISAAAQANGDGTVESSSCVQTIFPDYVCSIGFYNGTVATYNVEVATNGSSWHTT